MTGGGGNDLFVFHTIADSGPSPDVIFDLGSTDTIDLQRIDADTGAGGDQAFHIVAGLTGHAGELTAHYDGSNDLTFLYGDTDGDGGADLVIELAGDQTGFTNFVL
jgi:hypothetical protein